MGEHARDFRPVEIYTDFDYVKNEGKKDTVKIYPVDAGNFISVMGLIRQITNDIPKNEDVKEAVEKIVKIMQDAKVQRDRLAEKAEAEGWTRQEYTQAVNEEIFSNSDVSMIKDSASAIGFVIDYLPGQLYNIISVLTGISPDKLKLQEIETLFDIWDAIVEVNDIEKVVNRAKKSFKLSAEAFKLKEKVADAVKGINNRTQV